MTLTEAIEEVISITKRADKRTEIISNINKAILYFTLKASFAKDLVETSIPFSATDYAQSIDLTALAVPLTRFRKWKYLRPTSRRYYLNFRDPTQVVGPNGVVQTDTFYMAGDTLIVALSQLDSTCEVGYYTYPAILSEAGVTAHWMLTMCPWMVTERAASQTFKSIGDDVSATFYERSSNELFLTARADFEDQVADFAR
jgi:hypothetical protein